MSEKCELYDRECINCGECDVCDLDPAKRCDDCGRCIEEVDDYRSITINDFMQQNITKEQIDKISKKLQKKEIKNSEN